MSPIIDPSSINLADVAQWKATPAATAAYLSGKLTATQWYPAPHLLTLSKLIHQAATSGKPARIMVNMPPGFGKSEFISKWVPVWSLGNFPERRLICVSAGQELAETWGRATRDIVQDAGAAGLSSVSLSESSQSASRWHTQAGGGYVSLGVGSSLLGWRASGGLIIDDPYRSVADGCNLRVQQDVLDWFKGTLFSRLDPGAFLVIVMSRCHENDLCGQLLREDPDNWTVVSMPAMNPDGTSMWPERWTVEALKEKERGMSREAWAAQYMQSPLSAANTTGRVYRDFSRRDVRPTKYEPGVPLVVSCDWNLNFHALICQYRQRKNELTHLTNKFTADSVVLEEIGLPDSTTRDAAQEIIERLRKYAVAGHLRVTFVGDASGNQRNRVNADLNTDWKIFKAEISKAPFIHAEYPPCKRNPGVLESVGFVNAALRSDNGPPELTIAPCCRGLIKDFESVVFKRDHNGNFSTVISKDNPELTHFSDCARYFLSNVGLRKAYFGEVGYSLHC